MQQDNNILPAVQDVQVVQVAATLPENDPGAHGVHPVCPLLEYVPAGHSVAAVFVPTEGHWYPAVHGVHSDCPATEILPAGQETHPELLVRPDAAE